MPDDASPGAPSAPDQPGADGDQTPAPTGTAGEPEKDEDQTAALAASLRESAVAASVLDAPEFSPVSADDLTGGEQIIETIRPATRDVSWNPEQFTATTQSHVTFWLIVVLGIVLVLGAALLSTTPWTKITAQDVTDFFGIAFSAVVTLVTAATSFWFGTERGRRDQARK